MAVYTNITQQDLLTFLADYKVGELIEWKGIAEGVENSNFFVTTTDGMYVLTIYEKRINPNELPYFLTLKEHLAAQGVPCPVPIATIHGELSSTIGNKPAALVSFVSGKSTKVIRNQHVELLGQAMAQLHVAGQSFSMSRPNDLSLASWHTMFDTLRDSMDVIRPGLERDIADELRHLEQHWPTDLPTGVIHADLFPDNVFFQNGQLSGIIDFYFACNDFLVYDLAICLNAWCFEAHNECNITKTQRLLRGYNRIRPLSQQEIDALPILASGAAMRFLLTRIHDWQHQIEGALVTPKNPLEYWDRLCFHKGLTKASAYGL